MKKNKQMIFQTNRILNGEEFPPNKYPWLSYIMPLDPTTGAQLSICTGSVISKKAVLTAAHCCGKSFFIRYKTNKCNSRKERIKPLHPWGVGKH